MQDESWKKIGKCLVDSGMLMLIDPSYVIQETEDSVEFNYDEIVDKMFPIVDGEEKDSLYVELKKLGIAVSTGVGDGVYEVFGKIDKTKDGEVLKEVKVVFLD